MQTGAFHDDLASLNDRLTDGTEAPGVLPLSDDVAELRGNAVSATDNKSNVKVFAARDTDQIAVILLDQEQSTSFDYKVRLDNGTIAGNTLLVNVGAGVAAETTGTTADETTIVLVFDSSGVLKKIEYTAGGGTPSTTNY